MVGDKDSFSRQTLSPMKTVFQFRGCGYVLILQYKEGLRNLLVNYTLVYRTTSDLPENGIQMLSLGRTKVIYM